MGREWERILGLLGKDIGVAGKIDAPGRGQNHLKSKNGFPYLFYPITPFLFRFYEIIKTRQGFLQFDLVFLSGCVWKIFWKQ